MLRGDDDETRSAVIQFLASAGEIQGELPAQAWADWLDKQR